MKKIRYSEFESIQEVISHFNFKYDESVESQKQQFFDGWKEVVGEKIALVSRPQEVTQNKVLVISCANSFIANELFLEKNSLLELIQEKIKEYSFSIVDLKFDYKNWKK